MIVTVIGELCHDIFVYGDARRLSPEAPVPVLTHTHVETNLGMAGNVRQNLWALDTSLQIGLIHQTKEIKKQGTLTINQIICSYELTRVKTKLTS